MLVRVVVTNTDSFSLPINVFFFLCGFCLITLYSTVSVPRELYYCGHVHAFISVLRLCYVILVFETSTIRS
jgi:hypothetical protein